MVADLDKISLQELKDILDRYPYFALARKEYHIRLSHMSDDCRAADAGTAALYIASRGDLFRAVERSRRIEVKERKAEPAAQPVQKSQPETRPEHQPQAPQETASPAPERKVVVVGGDYFSQKDLSEVEKEEVPTFAKFTSEQTPDAPAVDTTNSNKLVPDETMYTETLAQIYANQGFSKQAIDIYSKLILLYPEKSAYFATLIEELKTKN